jgi:hypothetical protein
MQAKIIEIKMKWKRGTYEGTEACQATKKQQLGKKSWLCPHQWG